LDRMSYLFHVHKNHLLLYGCDLSSLFIELTSLFFKRQILQGVSGLVGRDANHAPNIFNNFFLNVR